MQWRAEALAQKEERQVVPTFHPEINKKTAEIIATREGAAEDVFTRQERERIGLEDRRKRAAEKKREEEGGLFMPQITSARAASDEPPALAPWEGSTPAHDWATKRLAKIEAAKLLRDEKRSGCRPYPSLESGSLQSSTLETPRRERTIVHDLPLPSLPSIKHSGKPVLMTAELHRRATSHRETLLQIQPSMRIESPRKFTHLKGNEHWLGYATPDPHDSTFVARENDLLLQRLGKIVSREPEYAYVEPIRPGGGKPAGSGRQSKRKKKAGAQAVKAGDATNEEAPPAATDDSAATAAAVTDSA